MQRILLVINAHKPRLSSFHFGCHIAALTKSKLIGLFIESVYSKEELDSISGDPYLQTVTRNSVDAAVKTDTDHAITMFVRKCATHNITTAVLVNKGEPIQEVLRESRYADLLVVDPGISFYGDDEQLPSHFTKEILANSECPVLLAPEKAADVEDVVFCYDGSASSVFAIKQFTYLLPEFRNKKVLLLEIKRFGANDSREDHQQILEWLQIHFDHVDYKTLSGYAKDELFTYFFMKEKKLVVMGSYGRSSLSNFFSHSAADSLIRTVDLPIFITHFNR